MHTHPVTAEEAERALARCVQNYGHFGITAQLEVLIEGLAMDLRDESDGSASIRAYSARIGEEVVTLRHMAVEAALVANAPAGASIVHQFFLERATVGSSSSWTLVHGGAEQLEETVN